MHKGRALQIHTHTSWPSLWETACALEGKHGPGSLEFGDDTVGILEEKSVGEWQHMIKIIAL